MFSPGNSSHMYAIFLGKACCDLESRQFSWNCFDKNDMFFSFATHFKSSSSPTSRELRELVVDEDDNGKFRLEMVKLALG